MSPELVIAAPNLAAIFEEHFDYVWNSLRRLGAKTADLEDLVHEVFLRVHAQLADYDPGRPMRPWLFGFAFRVASDDRRKARHRLEVFGSTHEPVDPASAADERVAATQERALVEEALGSVELERRAVLMMHDIDEVPIPEVARALGIPLNTGYSRLRLGRAEFAAAVTRLRKARGIK
ncbi:MAG TPA: RNA polymerase sigma factor [Polyangiaceae bacterium]